MDETIKTKRPAVKPRGGAYGAASISLRSKGRERNHQGWNYQNQCSLMIYSIGISTIRCIISDISEISATTEQYFLVIS